MALPQGINFRQTSGYVTDGANEDYEITSSSSESYPHTTAQGNNVGWETVSINYQTRDRQSGNDPRLAGVNWNDVVSADFRMDLPSAGNYNVGIAAGEGNYARDVAFDLYDTSSSLGSLTTGSTSAAQRFKDATNTEYTEVTWPTSQTLVEKTFSTTICRFRAPSASQFIAHVYVESAAVVRRWILGRP